MTDKLFELQQLQRDDWRGLFRKWKIGTGMNEYRIGRSILEKFNLTAEEYEMAIRELADWCGV